MRPYIHRVYILFIGMDDILHESKNKLIGFTREMWEFQFSFEELPID